MTVDYEKLANELREIVKNTTKNQLGLIQHPHTIHESPGRVWVIDEQRFDGIETSRLKNLSDTGVQRRHVTLEESITAVSHPPEMEFVYHAYTKTNIKKDINGRVYTLYTPKGSLQ